MVAKHTYLTILKKNPGKKKKKKLARKPRKTIIERAVT
jgi:hypothetical protein